MDYPTGVWIDIFPKDSVPDSPSQTLTQLGLLRDT